MLLERDNIYHHKANDKSKFVPVHAMKFYGSVAVQLHSFLASALGGGRGQHHTPAALLPGEELPESIV